MEYESVGLLHEQFVKQAKLTPDAIAVVSPDENQSVTFADLNSWTDTLAIILQSHGVKAETSVGIYLEKTINFVATYIAILKAGAGYLPLDTSYPTPMLESVLQDAQPIIVLASPDLAPRLDTYPAKQVLVLDEGWQTRFSEENQKNNATLQDPLTDLDSLAYVVYSSGTTGKPKGITCPQRGAVYSYHHRHTHFPYQDNQEREACNIFFVWEMLRPLMKGVPMYIMSNSVVYDPPLLCDFLAQNKITRMLFTPSLLETVVNTIPPETLKESFKTVRQVWFCGEVVTTSLLDRCMTHMPWVRFINLYSISECHDVACEDLSQYYRNFKESLLARKFCPVGHIMEGVEIIILNQDNKVQPVGMSGEIYVSGPTLARGYLNRPEVQKQRFVYMDVDGQQKRMYRTGDWGYMLSGGNLEICGRVDSMVKIRGYSIEVQAVESCLLSLPMVKACVVLVKGDEGDDKFLVAYIVSERETTKKEVRAELKKRLPFYMIPSYFLFLQSIPVVAATGKLDKSALPDFKCQQLEGVGAEGRPSTVTEVALAEIWIEVLQLKEVDIQESFFDLGGHSLMATELLQRARKKFQVTLAVKDLFLYPTISSLAKLIDARLANNNGSEAISNVNGEATEPKIDLHAEVTRHDQGVSNLDMQLRAFWRTFQHGHHFHRGRVLLTGATGFLGAFILKELLLHTKLVVYCLVRELPQRSAIDRIITTLRSYGILATDKTTETEEQALLEEAFMQRATPLKGNVSLLRLGLSEEDYTYLCTDIDFVIHSAASVNLAYPYSALHGPNVMGTANIIQFASTGKVKALHYIRKTKLYYSFVCKGLKHLLHSTNGVFPHGTTKCREDADVTKFADKLTDGYSQSKWVAEQLVCHARDRGLPVTIYRPGNLSGDSKKAYWNPHDFTLLILQACARTGMAPNLDWNMEMTPVDFVATVIVKLTQNPDCALGKTLHLVNDKPMKSKQVFQWMNSHGYPLQLVDFDEWKTRVIEELSSNGSSTPSIEAMTPVLESYISDASFLPSLSTFNNATLQKVLSEIGLLYPYTDVKLLNTYFKQLTARNLIGQKKNLSLTSPLAGQVAIVTGASSGIGKATALALAAAGAKVALAARSEQILLDIVKAIKDEGGEAIAVKTDVTDRTQMKDLVKQTESILGPVDILINNAGVMYYTLMKNLHEDEWERQIDVNCKGVTNGIGAVLDGMIKRGKGHIVNLSSDAGRKGFPGLAVYSGTKFYVEGLSQALRHEVAPSGIKVTCIQPGDVRTTLAATATDTEARALYDGSSKVQILEPSDVARAIVYAVSQPKQVSINEILIEPREAPI
ncbi:linear gramicidin synthase subunit D [Biomphalaria glabrata]|nr:linear gramicidin synthase subunit D-like [Biomphalaria glabrata]